MEYRVNNRVKILVVILVGLFLSPLILLLNKNKPNEPQAKPEPVVNIDEVVTKVKEENQNKELAYETTTIPEVISLVYQEDNYFDSFIIDRKTGKLVHFPDLIKEDKQTEYQNKEMELLSLKYPTFIKEALTQKEVQKYYYVKENEVIIYYQNFKLPYEYNEILSLTINYQEIKDYLNFTPNLDLEYTNEDGYIYDQNKKTIAITFDDGPSGKYNSLILETLKNNKAHATFFMVGYMMNSCQSCVLNTYNSQNEIGSHTYNHINIKNSTVAQVNDNVTKLNNLYNKITGDNIKLLRPPYGSYNRTNLDNLNVPLILWNLDTEDWRYRDVNHITEYIKEHVKDGSIILMHELYETSYQALNEILPWLYLNGYQVVSVGELATLKGRTLEPHKAYSMVK